MCGNIQLSESEKLKTEAALRKVLGSASKNWIFGSGQEGRADGFIREEGVRLEEVGGKELLTWGGSKFRGHIFRIFQYPIYGFFELSKRNHPKGRHEIFFPTTFEVPTEKPKVMKKVPGELLIAVYQHFAEPKKVPRFGVITGRDERTAVLCEKDRGPLILRPGDKFLDYLRKRNPVAA